MAYNGELAAKLASIKLLVMDVDGTLTDGGMYYTDEGDAMKRFHVRDGMGVMLLRRAGISSAIITSENSPIVLARAQKLLIDNVILGSRSKHTALAELADKLSVSLKDIAYIGDDVNDEHAMKIVGLSACPADAVPYIKNIASYVCAARGGEGAVRELAEMILEAQYKPNSLPEQW